MATTKRTAGSRADEAKRFRDLALEGPEVSVWTTDLRSGEIRLSAGWAVLLGDAPAEIRTTARELLALVHPDDVERVKTAAVQCMTGRAPAYDVQHRVRTQGGEWKWILGRGRVFERGAGGRALRMGGTVSDITERKRLEFELRHEEAMLQLIVDAMPAGIAYADAETRFRFGNREFSRIVKVPLEHAIGRKIRDVVGEEVWTHLAPNVEKALAGQAVKFERPQRWPDGRSGAISIHYVPDFDPEGRVVGFFGLLAEVTEEKQARAALAESEARFRNLTQLSSDWYWEQDENYRFTSMDGELESRTGIRSTDHIGKTRWELPALNMSEADWVKHKALLDARLPFRDLELRRPDAGGRMHWVSISGEPVFDGQGSFRGYRGVGRDITERKHRGALLDGQRRALELIARGAPLEETLTVLTQMIESQADGMLCSVLLLDADGMHLRHGAAPSLPEEYWRAIDGAAVGERAGSCGTAMFRRETVVVEDIAADPLWEDYRDHALRHGLRACWSTPIFDAGGGVLGSFAVYYRQPGPPAAQHRQLVEFASQTAAIAIGHARSENALRESEARYRTLIDVLPVGVLVNRGGKVVLANRAGAELLGVAGPEQALGVNLFDLIPEELRDTVRARNRQVEVERRENVPPLELDVTRTDGSRVSAEIMGVPVTIGGENAVLSIWRDISKRRQTQAALRDSEARFRSLTELSSDWYWEQDEELRLTFHSTGFDLSSGTKSAHLLGKRRWEEPGRVPLSCTWDEHRATLEARKPFRNFEYFRIGEDGKRVYASLSGEPVLDAQGAFRGYRGVGTNITERKRAGESLQAAEAQFRGLVEQSIAGIYVIQDGKLVYVNPRCAEILGYGAAAELIGHDALSLIAEADRASATAKMRQRTQSASQSISFNFIALRKDGGQIDIGAHGASASYQGRPAIIGMIQDISEKKHAEEKIQRYVVQIETAFMRTVEMATTLHEMRDPYTAGHERRVADIAMEIGAGLGFDAHRREGLRVAGYLHDIGKITIPSEILSKPSRLNLIEFQLIKGHAQASYDILKNVELPWPVAQVALQHHERLDGSGYPQGLKGEAILLEARIMAVADVVEAMSSHRPYRAGLGIEKALAEIERGRGTLYDPVVADACLKLFREKAYAIPVYTS